MFGVSTTGRHGMRYLALAPLPREPVGGPNLISGVMRLHYRTLDRKKKNGSLVRVTRIQYVRRRIFVCGAIQCVNLLACTALANCNTLQCFFDPIYPDLKSSRLNIQNCYDLNPCYPMIVSPTSPHPRFVKRCG